MNQYLIISPRSGNKLRKHYACKRHHPGILNEKDPGGRILIPKDHANCSRIGGERSGTISFNGRFQKNGGTSSAINNILL